MPGIRTGALVLLASLLLGTPLRYAHAKASPPIIMLTIKASPESSFETRLAIKDNDALGNLGDRAMAHKAPAPPVTDVSVVIRSDAGTVTFAADDNGNLYAEATGDRIELSYGKKQKLAAYIRLLRSVHYGETLPWEQVQTLIPPKRIFKVIDLETGLSFNAQRRAGKYHADVQPLTKEDSAVMKRIYNGKWSWGRKAVLIDTGRRLVAGSMNGMPHGGDGIPGNGFPGHFCIHFMGSLTHGSKTIDPQHQLMVAKAGGQVAKRLNAASPYEVIDTFFVSVNMDETHILKMTFPHAKHAQLPDLVRKCREIEYVRYRFAGQPQPSQDWLCLDIPVEVAIHRHGRRPEHAIWVFQMKRVALAAPWKIDWVQMKPSRVYSIAIP